MNIRIHTYIQTIRIRSCDTDYHVITGVCFMIHMRINRILVWRHFLRIVRHVKFWIWLLLLILSLFVIPTRKQTFILIPSSTPPSFCIFSDRKGKEKERERGYKKVRVLPSPSLSFLSSKWKEGEGGWGVRVRASPSLSFSYQLLHWKDIDGERELGRMPSASKEIRGSPHHHHPPLSFLSSKQKKRKGGTRKAPLTFSFLNEREMEIYK